MKMYIIIKEGTPDHMVPVIAAHASLACYKQFEQSEDMMAWMNGVFKKVVCSTTEIEFEQLKQVENHLVLTESSLNNQEVCIAFCPREEYPKRFRFLPMWKPQTQKLR